MRSLRKAKLRIAWLIVALTCLLSFQNCSSSFSKGFAVDSQQGASAISQPAGASGGMVYAWIETNWSSCSVQCGGGVQTRNVSCQNSNGDMVSENSCSQPKLATIQSCNVQSCSPTQSVPGTEKADLVLESIGAYYEPSCFADQSSKNIAVGTFNYKRIFSQKLGRKISLRAYAFYPPGMSPDQKISPALPVVAVFHGGGFMGGTPMIWYAKALRLASQGVLVVSFQYRDYNTFGDGDVIESLKKPSYDALSAVRWLRKFSANLGADPNRIVTAGDSAGGTLALLTSLLKQSPDDKSEDLLFSARPLFTMAINPVLDLSAYTPGGPGTTPVNLSAISPLHLIAVENLTPGVLILQGAQDPVTPARYATDFCNRENSVVANLCLAQVFPNYDHNFFSDGTVGWSDTITHLQQFLQWGDIIRNPRTEAPVNANCTYSSNLYNAASTMFGYSTGNVPGGVW